MDRLTQLVWVSLAIYFSGFAAAAELPEPGERISPYPSAEVGARPRNLEPPYILPKEFQECLSKILSFRDRNFSSTDFDVQFKSYSKEFLNYTLLRSKGEIRAGDWPPYQIDIVVSVNDCKIQSFQPSNLNEFENIPPHPEVVLE